MSFFCFGPGSSPLTPSVWNSSEFLPFFPVLEILKYLDLGPSVSSWQPSSHFCQEYAVPLVCHLEAVDVYLSVTCDVNLDHLVKLVFVRFLHIKFTISPFVTDYYLVQRYFEIIPWSCCSPDLCLTALASTDHSFLGQLPGGDSVFLSVYLYLLVGIPPLGRVFSSHLFISVSRDSWILVFFNSL